MIFQSLDFHSSCWVRVVSLPRAYRVIVGTIEIFGTQSKFNSCAMAYRLLTFAHSLFWWTAVCLILLTCIFLVFSNLLSLVKPCRALHGALSRVLKPPRRQTAVLLSKWQASVAFFCVGVTSNKQSIVINSKWIQLGS